MGKPDRERLKKLGEEAFILKMDGLLTSEEYQRLEKEALDAAGGDIQATAFLLKYRPGGFADIIELLSQK